MYRILVILQILIAFSKGSAKVEHVIVVSLDGGGSVITKNIQSLEVENLLKSGTFTFEAETVSPSVTLPSHTSMLTGVSPSKHKITWNTWIKSKGIVQVPTIFSLAKKAGYSTSFFTTKDKFKHLLIDGSIDKFVILSKSGRDIAKTAAEYFKNSKPSLMFVHIPDLDSQGHKNGWGSKEQVGVMKEIDFALRTIRDGIESTIDSASYLLIVTADHGGRKKSHGDSSDESKKIPWIVVGTGVVKGQELNTGVDTMDTASTIADQLGIETEGIMDGKSLSDYIFN